MRRILAFALTLSLAGPALAGGAEAFDSVMRGLPSDWDEAALSARANVGGASAYRIGENMSYHFEAAQDAHLVVIHRDSYGVANVIVPGPLSSTARLKAGEELSIEGLEAVAPVGRDVLYVIATRTRLSVEELGLLSDPGELATYNDRVAPDFAKRVVDAVSALDASDVAVVTIEYDVLGRGELEYTVDDVVAQLTPTRSVQRPKMAFHKVNFEFNSAQLGDQAKKNLDVLGQALQSPHLKNERFVLGGHTDDVGSETYNQQLSERRAAAAKAYLAASWNIAPERIETRGYGESRPERAGSTDEDRSVNRRVELEVVR